MGARELSIGKEYVYVRCPYYIREDRKRMQIKCEGLIDETNMYVRFGNLSCLCRHKDRFCKRDYRECPIAAALDRKYDF